MSITLTHFNVPIARYGGASPWAGTITIELYEVSGFGLDRVLGSMIGTATVNLADVPATLVAPSGKLWSELGTIADTTFTFSSPITTSITNAIIVIKGASCQADVDIAFQAYYPSFLIQPSTVVTLSTGEVWQYTWRRLFAASAWNSAVLMGQVVGNDATVETYQTGTFDDQYIGYPIILHSSPIKADSPYPADTATDVDPSVSQSLQWAGDGTETAFTVYFDNGTGTLAFLPYYSGLHTMVVIGTLLPSTTYTWRVDSTNAYGTTTGDTWTFTTGASTLIGRQAVEETIWFSETSDYDNFEEGVKDADSFLLVIPTQNNLRWIEALESLLVGTSGDEWRIGTNKLDTPLTPTNFTIRQQSTFGSAAIQAIKINESILFVDFVSRKIRELTYTGENYVAPDLCALAEHITKSGITSLTHQRNPDSIAWITLTDGTLLSFTYDRENNVTAWAKHLFDGDVQSVCVVPNVTAGEDEVWISVKRTIDEEDAVFIEKLASRTTATLAAAYFVDSGLTWSGTASNTLTAAHLVGETVSVLGTLAGVTTLYEDLTVAAGGTITLPDSATVTSAIFGLPFTAKVQPMRLVVNTPEGTSMGSITKVSEVVLSLMDSVNVKYGNTDDTLYDVDLTAPEIENSSEIAGLVTGDVSLSFDGGFSVQSPIIVVSSDPTPFNLRAIVARMEQSGR